MLDRSPRGPELPISGLWYMNNTVINFCYHIQLTSHGNGSGETVYLHLTLLFACPLCFLAHHPRRLQI